jgi:hypothetical protein
MAVWGVEAALQAEMKTTTSPSVRTRMKHFIEYSPFSLDIGKLMVFYYIPDQ